MLNQMNHAHGFSLNQFSPSMKTCTQAQEVACEGHVWEMIFIQFTYFNYTHQRMLKKIKYYSTFIRSFLWNINFFGLKPNGVYLSNDF